MAYLCEASPYKRVIVVNNSSTTKRVKVNNMGGVTTDIAPWTFKVFITGDTDRQLVNNLFSQ